MMNIMYLSANVRTEILDRNSGVARSLCSRHNIASELTHAKLFLKRLQTDEPIILTYNRTQH